MADERNLPKSFLGVLGALGPGIIIAGSIVGSGELIATTKVGAQAGFWLLWLIVIGCAIKVFTQVEIGRYTVTHSRTPLDGLNQVPGPRFKVNWLIWYWVGMTALVIVQQGGIAGGVGQSLAIVFPLTSAGERYNQAQEQVVAQRVNVARARSSVSSSDEFDLESLPMMVDNLSDFEEQARNTPRPHDELYWTLIVCVLTSLLLLGGKFAVIEWVSIVLVAGFTLVTVLTLVLLQMQPEWAVRGSELAQGFSFRLPPATEERSPLMTALAAFGIIGVGAVELIMYPYWCLEKGYARHTGRNDGSQAWIDRAKGWMRVMRIDAWLSMLVYTLATVGFYLLGASVLHRVSLDPESGDMIRTLGQMYVPVFGSWAQPVFLLGAFAVLYSTLFVAAAGNSRMVADSLSLFGFLPHGEATRLRWSRIISGIWPLAAGLLYVVVRDAPRMVLACGAAQMLMLPLLGVAALWFRYRRSLAALQPGKAWDLMLWLSVVGFFLAAGSWLVNQFLQYRG